MICIRFHFQYTHIILVPGLFRVSNGYPWKKAANGDLVAELPEQFFSNFIVFYDAG